MHLKLLFLCCSDKNHATMFTIAPCFFVLPCSPSPQYINKSYAKSAAEAWGSNLACLEICRDMIGEDEQEEDH